MFLGSGDTTAALSLYRSSGSNVLRVRGRLDIDGEINTISQTMLNNLEAIREAYLPLGAPSINELRTQRNELLGDIARAVTDYHAALIANRELQMAHRSDTNMLYGFMLVLGLVLLVLFVFLMGSEFVKYKDAKRQRDIMRPNESSSLPSTKEREIYQLFVENEERDILLRLVRTELVFLTLICVCICLLIFANMWRRYMRAFNQRAFEFDPSANPMLTNLFLIIKSDVIVLYALSMDPNFVPIDGFSASVRQKIDGRQLPLPRTDILTDSEATSLVKRAEYDQLYNAMQDVNGNSQRHLDVVHSYNVNSLTLELSDAAEKLQKLLLRQNDPVEGDVSGPLTQQQLTDIVRNELVPALHPPISLVHHMRCSVTYAFFDVTAKCSYVAVPGADATIEDIVLRGSLAHILKQLSDETDVRARSYRLNNENIQWELPLQYTSQAPDVRNVPPPKSAIFSGSASKICADVQAFPSTSYGFMEWVMQTQPGQQPPDGDTLTPKQAGLQEFLVYKIAAQPGSPGGLPSKAEVMRKVIKLLEDNLGLPGFAFQYLSVSASGSTVVIHLYRRDRRKGMLGALAVDSLQAAMGDETAVQQALNLVPDVSRYTSFELLRETNFTEFMVLSADLLDSAVVRISSSMASDGNAPPIGVYYPSRPLRGAVSAWQPQEPLNTVAELSELLKRGMLTVMASHKFAFTVADVKNAVLDGAIATWSMPDGVVLAQLRQAYIDILQDTENDAAAAVRSGGGSERFISYDRFKAKLMAMRGMDVAATLLAPLYQMAQVGDSLQQHYTSHSMYFGLQVLVVKCYRLGAALFSVTLLIWMVYYTVRRFGFVLKTEKALKQIKDMQKQKDPPAGTPLPPQETAAHPDNKVSKGKKEDAVQKANKYVDEYLLRQALVWAVAIMLIVIVFAYTDKSNSIEQYNESVATYNSRQLITSADEATELLVSPTNNGPSVNFGLQTLLASSPNLLRQTASWFDTTVAQIKPQLKDPVVISGSDTAVQQLYALVTEVLRAYESGNTLLLTRTKTPFPYIDVIGNGVLLLLTIGIAVFVYRTMNPFDNLEMARELKAKLDRHRREQSESSATDLMCLIARDANSYEIQQLTIRLVIGVVGIFFVITYITKVHRSGSQYGAALYGSNLYRQRMAYRLS
ncbi:hypothetical protein PLESTB_000878400 [Pleodorina starrii]|uniref:Uncharacterized protein n=1 Tax=Pleodorina starrii TaxID=330485 RepID=A0A9W6BMY8_9CHLO|nr:hypothetical protein PLESTB_000878400 [Pleodorina starrii]